MSELENNNPLFRAMALLALLVLDVSVGAQFPVP